LRGLTRKEIVHEKSQEEVGLRLILAIRAQKLLGQGCEGYICNVVRTKTPKTSLENIPVVQEFPNVFLEEI